MKKTKHLLAALAMSAPFALCHPAKAEGIDCSKAANYVDKIVCADADIKAQDATMAELFAVARISMFGKGPSGEIAKQKGWLANRKDCLALAADKRASCVLKLYKARNLELAFSAMPKAPEAALKILHDQNVETEPYYEALSIFASEPDGADWFTAELSEKREKIIKLVIPVFEDIQKKANADPSKHFNAELFEDGSISKPEDILKSSRDFAGFFRATTFDATTPIPCGYIVTHQSLIDATNSYFGSTADNFIINSNCSVTAPPTPNLDYLVRQINKAWPTCDGTIRFSAYRSFNVAVDKVLSPSARAIEDYRVAPPQAKDQDHALAGVKKKTIHATESEMTAYYVKYLGVTPAKAAVFAKGKIADVLNDGQLCE